MKKLLLTLLALAPEELVQARKDLGLTQKQLAEKLGLKEQQIQQYEASRYQSASLKRIIEVAKVLSE